TLTINFGFVDLATLLSDPAGAFHLTWHLPNWDSFHFDAPSILTLLSDPGTIVDGLDTILSTLQDVLGGQIFGQSLPLVGDILIRLLNADGTVGNIFTARSAQFDFTLGHAWSFTAAPIDLDLGIPALGIQARFIPQLNIAFQLHFGFGVSLDDGFYFVTQPP